jgi:hypothetical protein
MDVNDRLDRLEKVVTDLAITVTGGQHLPDMCGRIPAAQQANAELLKFLREGAFERPAGSE